MRTPISSTAVDGIVFEWDPRKDKANVRKHGVGFAEASTVFGDPLSITIPDPDHSQAEERFVTIGASNTRKLVIVIHTVRGEALRIISARAATKQEKESYEENTP